MLFLRSDRQQSAGSPRLGGCASALQRAGLAILGRKTDLDHLVVLPIERRSPTHAGVPLWADRLLVLPIKRKLATLNALLGVSLPRAH